MIAPLDCDKREMCDTFGISRKLFASKNYLQFIIFLRKKTRELVSIPALVVFLVVFSGKFDNKNRKTYQLGHAYSMQHTVHN